MRWQNITSVAGVTLLAIAVFAPWTTWRADYTDRPGGRAATVWSWGSGEGLEFGADGFWLNSQYAGYPGAPTAAVGFIVLSLAVVAGIALHAPTLGRVRLPVLAGVFVAAASGIWLLVIGIEEAFDGIETAMGPFSNVAVHASLGPAVFIGAAGLLAFVASFVLRLMTGTAGPSPKATS